MQGDGNGWVDGKYWGLHGAAGLFLLIDAHVLLQHRAAWTADGGTWGIPGGARDSHETPAEAALRETREECGIDPALVTVAAELVTTHVPGWTYTTVIGTAEEFPQLTANEESEELRWVPLTRIREFPLHPGFEASLEQVLGHTVVHD